MPTGTPYHGRVPPYSDIRVDAFSTRLGEEEVTHLHLLTHVHSDHIVGLETPSFGQLVVCSLESKNILLKAEKGPDRIAYDRGLIPHVVRPWAHLHTKARDGRGISRDLLVCEALASFAPEAQYFLSPANDTSQFTRALPSDWG